jgi:hypothetical protein
MMNDALKIAEQYTTDEISQIMENENESEWIARGSRLLEAKMSW